MLSRLFYVFTDYMFCTLNIFNILTDIQYTKFHVYFGEVYWDILSFEFENGGRASRILEHFLNLLLDIDSNLFEVSFWSLHCKWASFHWQEFCYGMHCSVVAASIAFASQFSVTPLSKTTNFSHSRTFLPGNTCLRSHIFIKQTC